MRHIAAMLEAGDPAAAEQAAKAHVRRARAAAFAIYETSRNAALQSDREKQALQRRI
jgi:DNA-binding GntR family transcriptional regulator